MTKEQFAEGSPSSGTSVNRSRQIHPSAVGSRHSQHPTPATIQKIQTHNDYVKTAQLRTIQESAYAPLDRRHREAIPLILDQMEGFTPQAVPSLCGAKPRCF